MYENRLEEILNSEFKAYELLDFIDNDEFEKELIEFTQYGIKESVLRSFPSENSTYLAGKLNSSVFFPAINISSILFSLILSLIIYKEKPTKKDLAVLLLSITSIILVNL